MCVQVYAICRSFIFFTMHCLFSSVCASPTNIIAILFVITSDNFSRLAPFEVIRMEKRIYEDDDVHEGRRKEVEEVPDEILEPLKVISW